MTGAHSFSPPASASAAADPPEDTPFDDEITTQIEDKDEAPVSASKEKRDRCTLTMLAGPTTGAIYTVDEDQLVFGRGREAKARIQDRNLSRLHARIYVEGQSWKIVDLGSTNGTFVNGEPVDAPRELVEGDRIQMGREVLLRFQLHDEFEQEATRRIYESAVRDPLTRVHNRRYLDERLEGEFAFARRHGTALSVLILDIDHFKQVNDEKGHLAGDAVLRVVAASIHRILRAEDVVARYGGEEFCVVARGVDQNNALIIAERLRRTVEQLKIPCEGETIRVTISCGVATFRPDHAYADVEGLLADADSALYRAKESGRNRCMGTE